MENSRSGDVNGFMLATVLSNDDPEKKGKLKLRLLCEGQAKNILEDVKVVTPFGGETYGVYCLPEVGDQVLVGFLGGCYDRPFVFGSVYTSADKMVTESFQKENACKRIVTKAGSVVEISDAKGEEAIRIQSPEKKLTMEFSQKTETVTVAANQNKLTLDGKSGTIKLEADKKILLKTGSAELTMDSSGNVKLKGTQVECSGSQIKISSSGLLNMKGQSTEMSGAMVNLKADGVMTIKGSMTKIN